MIKGRGPWGIQVADNFPVEILNENRELITEKDSIKKAAEYCQIRLYQSVWRYLFIKATGKRSNKRNGVLSKATGKRYHFKLKKHE